VNITVSLPGRIVGVGVLALVFVFLSNTLFFEQDFTLMERGFVSLTLVLLWRAFFATSPHIILPLPLLLLIAVMGFSTSQFLRANIVEDFLGAAAVAFVGIIAASSLPLRDIVSGIAVGVTAQALWILIFTLTSPLASWTIDGLLIGPYTHWTGMGLSLLFGVPAVLAARIHPRPLSLLLKVIALALIGGEIWLSGSRTSWLTLAAVLVAAAIIFVFVRRRAWALWMIGAVFLSLIVAAVNYAQTLAAIGKNPDITGRTKIWGSIASHFWERPVLGFGWSRLFPKDSVIFNYIFNESGVPANHSHNDFLHWYVTTGFVGLLTFVACLVLAVYLGLRMLKESTTQSETMWPLLSLVVLVVASFAEITTFQLQGGFVFALVLATSVVAMKNKIPRWVSRVSAHEVLTPHMSSHDRS
jgi:exopolysaccharide production protein ExoQ